MLSKMSLRSISSNARESLAVILVSLRDTSDNSEYTPLRYISPVRKSFVFAQLKRRILAHVMQNYSDTFTYRNLFN